MLGEPAKHNPTYTIYHPTFINPQQPIHPQFEQPYSKTQRLSHRHDEPKKTPKIKVLPYIGIDIAHRKHPLQYIT